MKLYKETKTNINYVNITLQYIDSISLESGTFNSHTLAVSKHNFTKVLFHSLITNKKHLLKSLTCMYVCVCVTEKVKKYNDTLYNTSSIKYIYL